MEGLNSHGKRVRSDVIIPNKRLRTLVEDTGMPTPREKYYITKKWQIQAQLAKELKLYREQIRMFTGDYQDCNK